MRSETWRRVCLLLAIILLLSATLGLRRKKTFERAIYSTPIDRHKGIHSGERSVYPRWNLTVRANDPLQGQQYWDSREDPPTSWQTAILIGEWMTCIMNGALNAVQQSTWRHFAALQAYGWSVTEGTINLDDYALVDIFDSLDISIDRDDWTVVHLKHRTTTSHTLANGATVQYTRTRASYENAINLQDGVIVSMFNYGPDFMNGYSRLGIPKDQIVPLKQWSDLIYLTWQNPHVRDPRYAHSIANLNHVFRYDIVNIETKRRMMEAMGRKGVPPAWPGLQWPIRDVHAKALLNTSNSAGVAWLLGQHKAGTQLGVRVIDEVRIFSIYGSGQYKWNMYFHVVAGPLGPGKL